MLTALSHHRQRNVTKELKTEKKRGGDPLSFFILNPFFFHPLFTKFVYKCIKLKSFKFAACYGTGFASFILRPTTSFDIVKIRTLNNDS